jgi:hypothetical protein
MALTEEQMAEFLTDLTERINLYWKLMYGDKYNKTYYGFEFNDGTLELHYYEYCMGDTDRGSEYISLSQLYGDGWTENIKTQIAERERIEREARARKVLEDKLRKESQELEQLARLKAKYEK